MADREKVKTGLELCQQGFDCPPDCPYLDDCNDLMKPMFIELAKDALELLKEQEEQVKQWSKEIADNQLAHAPNDSPMSLDEQLECEYKRGIWDGLQMAWDIISEGR